MGKEWVRNIMTRVQSILRVVKKFLGKINMKMSLNLKIYLKH